MGRKSTKESKNIYQNARESLNLSRARACELLEGISESRLFRIENGETLPYPEEVNVMAKVYKAPGLCNYYCANDCLLGQAYVPQVEVKDLPIITLEMLNILNLLTKEKDRLIEIAVDGRIDPDEVSDFKRIRSELEKMSMTIETKICLIATEGLNEYRKGNYEIGKQLYIQAMQLARESSSDPRLISTAFLNFTREEARSNEAFDKTLLDIVDKIPNDCKETVQLKEDIKVEIRS